MKEKNFDALGKKFRDFLVAALKNENDEKPTLTAENVSGKIVVRVNPVLVEEFLAKNVAKKKNKA